MRRANGAAIAERLMICRRRPLLGKAEHQRMLPIGNELRRDGSACRGTLIIISVPCGLFRCDCDVTPTGAPDALREPTLGICRTRERDLRMRDSAIPAQRRERLRILG